MRIFACIKKGSIPFNIEEYGLNPEELLVIPRRDENAPNSFANAKELSLFFAKTGDYSRSPLSVKERHNQLFSELSLLTEKIDAFINFSKTADLEIAVDIQPRDLPILQEQWAELGYQGCLPR